MVRRVGPDETLTTRYETPLAQHRSTPRRRMRVNAYVSELVPNTQRQFMSRGFTRTLAKRLSQYVPNGNSAGMPAIQLFRAAR
jgi:hypothetical protein